jgi:hypothetical protein
MALEGLVVHDEGEPHEPDRSQDDQEQLSWNYGNRVHTRAFPVTFRFRGLYRDGSTVPMETEMIPLTFGGHTIAYHFVRRVSA